jgi:quinol monooxygenase YgiN
MIVLSLHARVRPGLRPDLERFLAEARPVYEEPGGTTVRLLWSLTDPDAFVEVMEYRDRAVYEADQVRVEQDPRMRALIERWHALLAEGPTVTVHEEVPLR